MLGAAFAGSGYVYVAVYLAGDDARPAGERVEVRVGVGIVLGTGEVMLVAAISIHVQIANALAAFGTVP